MDQIQMGTPEGNTLSQNVIGFQQNLAFEVPEVCDLKLQYQT